MNKRSIALILACSLFAFGSVNAQDAPTQFEPEFEQQSEAEFQEQMPITGTVETFFGDFKLDHSFPEAGEADRIYDIIDHQRPPSFIFGVCRSSP